MRGTGNESSGAGSKACWSGSKVKETFFQEAFPTPPLSSLPGFHGFFFFFFFFFLKCQEAAPGKRTCEVRQSRGLGLGNLVTVRLPGRGGAGECLVPRWLLDTMFLRLTQGAVESFLGPARASDL